MAWDGTPQSEEAMSWTSTALPLKICDQGQERSLGTSGPSILVEMRVDYSEEMAGDNFMTFHSLRGHLFINSNILHLTARNRFSAQDSFLSIILFGGGKILVIIWYKGTEEPKSVASPLPAK